MSNTCKGGNSSSSSRKSGNSNSTSANGVSREKSRRNRKPSSKLLSPQAAAAAVVVTAATATPASPLHSIDSSCHDDGAEDAEVGAIATPTKPPSRTPRTQAKGQSLVDTAAGKQEDEGEMDDSESAPAAAPKSNPKQQQQSHHLRTPAPPGSKSKLCVPTKQLIRQASVSVGHAIVGSSNYER